MSIMNYFKRTKNYVSETDSFLSLFDERYPTKSLSQLKEIENYQHLFQQRDKKLPNKTPV